MPMTMTFHARESPDASSASVREGAGVTPIPSIASGTMVAGTHHVADAQARRQLHVDLSRLQSRGPVLVVWPQAG